MREMLGSISSVLCGNVRSMNDIGRNILELPTKDFGDTELQARTMTTLTSQPPALWNPYAAARWSLIFSGAFGAFLHAQNADAMGRVEEAKANRVWCYLWIAYFCFVMVTSSILVVPKGLLPLVSLGLSSGWYFSLGRKQATYVKETLRDGYERRPWVEPLLIAFFAFFGWAIIGSMIAVAIKLAFRLR
jgi:hypothetical protein